MPAPMQLHRFVAPDAAHAVRQIQTVLGPEAVVTQVNARPAAGFRRWFRKPQLEVLAYVPAPAETPAPRPGRDDTACLRADHRRERGRTEPFSLPGFLEQTGLLPVVAEQVAERARTLAAPEPIASLADAVHWTRAALRSWWPETELEPEAPVGPAPEIFVGPHGTGKTTVLAKWLTQSVLGHGRQACVWLVDGSRPNLPGPLTLHCEMLGVSVHRGLQPPALTEQQCFVDVGGISPSDTTALLQLETLLRSVPSSRVHLCLNAAYSTAVLNQQLRVFSRLPVRDLIFTHLDEEKAWGKLWNFVVGTNYPIRFLASGQNLPGDLHRATPEALFQGSFDP